MGRYLRDSMGNIEASSTFSQEALAVWNVVGDPRGRAAALYNLAEVEEHYLHRDEAANLFDQAAAICRELGHPDDLGRVLLLRGGVAYAQGESTGLGCSRNRRPRTFVKLAPSAGSDRPSGYWGCLRPAKGDSRRLHVLPEESQHADRCRRRRLALQTLAGLAAVAVENGDVESAARLLGAVDTMLLRRVATCTHCTGLCTSGLTLPLVRPWSRSGSKPCTTPVDG